MSAPHEIAYPAIYAAPETQAPTVSEYDAAFVEHMDRIVAYQTEGQGQLTPEIEAELFDAIAQGRDAQTETAITQAEAARIKLFEGTMRYAYDLAQNSTHPDRNHIAFTALTVAINDYDPGKQWSFKQTVKRAVSQGLRNAKNAVERQRIKLESDPGTPPIMVPLAHVTYPHAAPEEAEAASDGPVSASALSLAEFAMGQTDEIPEMVATSTKGRRFQEMLQSLMREGLSDAQSDVIVRHLGLFGTQNETFEHIGETRGKSHERVRQLEREGMRGLRESAQSHQLDDFLDDTDSRYPYHATQAAGDALRTGRVPAVAATERPTLITTVSTPRREAPKPPEGRLERGTDWYNHYYRMLETRLAANNNPKYHGNSTRTTPYPKELFDIIEGDIGKYLNPQHIEDAWNTLTRQLIFRATGNNPREVTGTRLCQLFSALLIHRMTDDDHVTVQIPAQFDGQWDDIGAWARRGKITIVGEPGKNVGRHKSENAQIKVIKRQY